MSESTPPFNAAQQLAAALAHHQAGRLAQAEAGYRQILAVNPDEPEALHLLGVLAHQVGQSAQALPLITRSVALAPTFASLSNLGEILRTVGRPAEAVTYLRRSIELNPNWPDTHSNLGLALLDLRNLKDAEKAFRRAIELSPQRADMHMRLCRALTQADDPYGAIPAGRRAVELQPTWGEAWSTLALALSATKKHAEALEAALRAVEFAAQSPDAHVNLGVVRAAAGDAAGAEAAYRKAIELNPDFALAHRNLAALLDASGQTALAVAALERSLQLQPNDAAGWVTLSTLRRRAQNYPGALEAAQTGLRLQPNSPEAHGNLGLAMLGLGQYERGFAEYEWRWRCSDFTTAPRDFGRPMWDGSDPTGRTIFVHCEQGYGDNLQFARYIPMLAARGANVLLEVPLPLRNLFAGIKGVSKLVTSGVRPPDFDLHIPLLSLPRIFKTTLDSVPADVPYLAVDEPRLALWKTKLASIGKDTKVGLVWAGNVKPDANRTCPLSMLTPLGQVSGITFVSLQKQDNPQGAESPPAGMKFVDVAADLKDFADTAAAMINLDLIITIDTAAAHLAGALGRPTWMLLPWAADWRWLENREDSPWYPTMRIFRQPTRGDWPSVASRIAEALRNR